MFHSSALIIGRVSSDLCHSFVANSRGDWSAIVNFLFPLRNWEKFATLSTNCRYNEIVVTWQQFHSVCFVLFNWKLHTGHWHYSKISVRGKEVRRNVFLQVKREKKKKKNVKNISERIKFCVWCIWKRVIEKQFDTYSDETCAICATLCDLLAAMKNLQDENKKTNERNRKVLWIETDVISLERRREIFARWML